MMWNNVYEWAYKIVAVLMLCAAIYFYVETMQERRAYQSKCIELKTQVVELQSELTAAKSLVQKNEIGELKRRWRLFGER